LVLLHLHMSHHSVCQQIHYVHQMAENREKIQYSQSDGIIYRKSKLTIERKKISRKVIGKGTNNEEADLLFET
jgi:hypothetical protein